MKSVEQLIDDATVWNHFVSALADQHTDPANRWLEKLASGDVTYCFPTGDDTLTPTRAAAPYGGSVANATETTYLTVRALVEDRLVRAPTLTRFFELMNSVLG